LKHPPTATGTNVHSAIDEGPGTLDHRPDSSQQILRRKGEHHDLINADFSGRLEKRLRGSIGGQYLNSRGIARSDTTGKCQPDRSGNARHYDNS
jgi:hypothetical protein